MYFFIRFIICVMLLFKVTVVNCMQQTPQESTIESIPSFWRKATKVCFPGQNFKQMHECFEKEAEQTQNIKHYVLSLYSLGLMSYFGLGVNQNFKAAFQFFNQAAKQNDQIRVYIKPLIKLCEETAAQNDNLVDKAKAESLLGVMYYFNHALSSNYTKYAYQFCNMAINQANDMSAHAESLCLLGYMYFINYSHGFCLMRNYNCDQKAIDCFNQILQEPLYSQEAKAFAAEFLEATKLEQLNKAKEK